MTVTTKIINYNCKENIKIFVGEDKIISLAIINQSITVGLTKKYN